ncbi:prohead protease/major capsid protein fusion protein [Blastochloris sulfoviridis]|uniref:Peptidase U35 n=1 Tax=Blastochloris sulfoviridis TaxID=50712 RepID=A0A5M6HTD8_9HYPH|nr:prohead protease/major capsid protein fusion protein [Blastochloris sulfoviridis]KAA5599232.1 peptidase U35 [Blastochloris sulfoviridis]
MPPAETETLITRRAPEAPTSWNAEARTFEVVFATSAAAVDRYDMRGPYRETLAVEGFTVVDPTPFLDGHRRDSLDAVLGQIVSSRAVGGKASAVVRLSRNNPLALRLGQDLADGMRFGVSCGYTVEEWRETTNTKTGIRTKVALRWTVREISVVTIPADRQATTRGAAMADPTPTPAPAPATDPAALPPVTSPTIAPAQPPATETRSASPEIQNRANVNTEIRAIARTLGLSQSWVDGQIDRSATADQARAAALDELQRRSAAGTVPTTPVVTFGVDYTDPAIRVRAAGEALYSRTNRSHNLSEPARRYAEMSMPDLARECCRAAGVPLAGLSTASIVTRALHTTSDFALILGDAVGRTLRDSYQAVPSALKRLGRQQNATDFRTRHRIQFGGNLLLERVNESGEVKSGTLAEAKEAYRLETFAKMFGISRQALANDDLGAFADMPRRLGQLTAATEAKLLAGLLTEGSGLGPVMADGKRLFHTDHGNLASAGTVIDVGTLGAARLAMRAQTGLSGELVSVTPKYLVVSSTKETEGEMVLAAISPATVDDVNPFSGKLELIVEPRLTGNRWYLAASPAEIDGLEWAYLSGEEGPQVETRAGFEVEGVQMKVRLDFGAGFVDHRSWYSNPGA